jgi:hypothetical protein
MALTFRAKQVTSNSASASLTIPAPTLVAGDLLITLVIPIKSSTIGAIQPPTGWTQRAEPVFNLVDNNLIAFGYLYTKIATASEPANYVWGFSGVSNNFNLGWIGSYAGPDATTQWLSHASSVAFNEATAPVIPAFTATESELLFLWALNDEGTSVWTAPAGMTAREWTGGLLVCDQAISAGSTGTRTPTNTIVADGFAYMAGFKSPAGGGATIVSAVGTSAGFSTVAGVARARASSAGAAAGLATLAGVSLARIRVASVGTVAGGATVAGVSSARIRVASAGAAAGLATVAGIGQAVAVSVGTSAGLADVTGVSSARIRVAADGLASGLATVAGVSAIRNIQAAAGLATGSSSSAGVARATASSAGPAHGSSGAIGVTGAGAIVPAAGLATGSSGVTGQAVALVSSIGLSAGLSSVEGASVARVRVAAAGLAAGAATVLGYSLPFAGPSDTVAFVRVGIVRPCRFVGFGLEATANARSIGIEPRAALVAAGVAGEEG